MAELSEASNADLESVPFGRSRMLRLLGAGAFALATRSAFGPGTALAYHQRIAPCGPSGRCHCCSGTSCCQSGCTARNGDCQGTTNTENSWRVCHGGHQHRCADWRDGSGRKCICAGTYEMRCDDQPCGTGTNTVAIFGLSAAAPDPRLVSTGTFVGSCLPNGQAPASLIPVAVINVVVLAEQTKNSAEQTVDALSDNFAFNCAYRITDNISEWLANPCP